MDARISAKNGTISRRQKPRAKRRGAFIFPCRAETFSGAEGRNRTGDTGIFSAVLYRLSYLGVAHLAGNAASVGDRGLEPLTSTV